MDQLLEANTKAQNKPIRQELRCEYLMNIGKEYDISEDGYVLNPLVMPLFVVISQKWFGIITKNNENNNGCKILCVSGDVRAALLVLFMFFHSFKQKKKKTWRRW